MCVQLFQLEYCGIDIVKYYEFYAMEDNLKFVIFYFVQLAKTAWQVDEFVKWWWGVTLTHLTKCNIHSNQQ
jgi:hypothetical protein